MNSRLPRFLAGLLLVALAIPAQILAGGGSLSDIEPAEVVYIVPAMTGSDDVERVRAGDRELIVFDELVQDDDQTAQVRRQLEASAAFGAIRRLYALSRSVGRESGAGQGYPEGIFLYVGSLFGDVGPAHASRTIRLRRQSGEEIDPAGFIIISAIRGGDLDLSVADLVKEKYLALTLVHEVGHQILSELYRPHLDLVALSYSRGGRDVMTVTDPVMALNEGWAEGLEAMVGELLVDRGETGFGEQSTDPAVRAMFRGRQDTLRRHKYLWDTVGETEGETRNGLQMMSSEGVVAYLLYQLMTDRVFSGRNRVEGFRKVIDVLARHRPRNLAQAMNALVSQHPDFKNVAARHFYEWTKYATHSQQGPALYKKVRTARLAFLRYQRKDETSEELAVELRLAKAEYEEWKDEVFQRVMSRNNIADPLPDPLWLDFQQDRIGLNLATAGELSRFLDRVWGRDEQHLVVAEKITGFRDSPDGGYFQQVGDLRPLLEGQSVERLAEARQQFQYWHEANRSPTAMAAYIATRADRLLSKRLQDWGLADR